MMRTVLTCVLGATLALAAGCNDASLYGLPQGPPDIQADPEDVDFGRLELYTADRTETINLTNIGGLALEIPSLSIDPPGGVTPYVITVTNASQLPSPSQPLVVEHQQSVEVVVTYAPDVTGAAPATLLVASNDPDTPTLEIPLFGHGFTIENETTVQDEYLAFADILFVVDTSGSMGGEQVKLASSFDTFINWVVAEEIDFHIGVTTTDMSTNGEKGAFVGPVLDQFTPNIISEFNNQVTLGTSGSAQEQGFAPALAAVTSPLAQGANAGFLRADANLYIVFVSDEDDQSPGTPAQYASDIGAVKGGDMSKVYMAAIAGEPPTGCSGAYSADRYFDMAKNQTSGLFGSICDTDFGVTLQTLAFVVTAPTDRFQLSQIPDPLSIEVIVDGTPFGPEAWYYDPADNSVVFFDGYVPLAGAQVEIIYETL